MEGGPASKRRGSMEAAKGLPALAITSRLTRRRKSKFAAGTGLGPSSAGEPLDGAPLVLGRPAGATLAFRRRCRSGHRGHGFTEFLVEPARAGRIPPPLCKAHDLQDAHSAIECDGDDVACLHRTAR